jgi:hypothetical protein
MQSSPNNRFEPYIESVDEIVSAVKQKERYIEEQNMRSTAATSDVPDTSEKIKEKLVDYRSLLDSGNPNSTDQKNNELTDGQKKILEKVIEDANRAIEADNLRAVRESLESLESFRERISSS